MNLVPYRRRRITRVSDHRRYARGRRDLGIVAEDSQC